MERASILAAAGEPFIALAVEEFSEDGREGKPF